MDSIVALDIETTGLDPAEDAIIDIGAVRFNDRRVEDEWSTLIHPGRRIPPFITQLTGITDQMILNAPSLQEMQSDLEDFVNDSPIVGHNINFDVSFLRRGGLFKGNQLVDTYELAAVLLPSASRYNLSSLTQALGVPFPATHRALDDARATRGILLRLWDKAHNLPLNLLAEIIRMGDKLDWNGYWAFRQVLKERSTEIVSPQSIQHHFQGPLFTNNLDHQFPPLKPTKETISLDTEEVAALLESGGAFGHNFPEFEYRPQQVAMLNAVSEALSEQRHLIVEAGTGIGKSIAYLLPAALWAVQNGRRIVISTNTINLQDQLINKDIPDVRKTLKIDLHATVLKGRSNYLCPRRLENMRRRGPENIDELRVIAKVLVWLQVTKTGDRGEINLNGPAERQAWMRLSSEDEACNTENCLKHTNGSCPFYRVHRTAQNAHLVIVNHALLLADVATGNRVLPEYEYLIVDEAHHLEDATTDALSYQVTQNDVERLLRQLGGKSTGTLAWLLDDIDEILSQGEIESFNELVQHATDLAFQFQNLLRQFFKNIELFLSEQRDGHPVGMYSHRERIITATRSQPAWSDVEIAWDEAQNALQLLIDTLAKIIQGVAEVNDKFPDGDEELHSMLSNIYRRFSEFNDQVSALVFEPVTDRVYWAEEGLNTSRLALHAAPLHIGTLMERYVWHEKSAVILTSATLTTLGEFDYLRGRLNAEDAYELMLGSPFDFETASLLYLVNDIPEPNDRQRYQKAVGQGLIRLCQATSGRTLALFTSYDQLRRTARVITPVLAKQDIQVYAQGEGASPHTLLETFRNSERSVLLGTRAFWEGVDVPGEALSVLVIVKLPFDVPSDPIIAARAESFDDSFYQYSLPEAILRFRQGFGRLIRSQNDRGVVAVFDRRVISKKYGRFFIESLPQCTVQVGPMSDLPANASRWLNL